ncbi:MAG: outer membrane protein assembly factor BamD, partial [Planctomycetes bacterium]|nr:outer membrane protein assembly factor BamD [Planctomycetota bacterium]
MACEIRNLSQRLIAHRIITLVLIAGLSSGLSGCRSPLDMTALFNRDVDQDARTSVDISDEKGPLERALGVALQRRGSNSSKLSEEDREEFQRAENLYDEQRYAAAEKAFKQIAKKYKRTTFNLWGEGNNKKDLYRGTENNKYENKQIVEDALFMLAESQYQQKKYAATQDTFSALVKEFPSTRYLNNYTRRMFSIARYWLGFSDNGTTGDMTLAGLEGDDSPKVPALNETPRTSWDPSRRIPILPNFFDKTRPAFDTDGRALEALRMIWINDPNGPLADDALMVTASYYLRKQNYSEADHMFEILRKEYPKSPHHENALLLGSHVKLMSYQGPAYDSKSLVQAQQLKEHMLKTHPNSPTRDRMLDELRNIEEAKAEQDWEDVFFYYQKRNPQAMEVYCNEIIRKHPQTSYAALARSLLAELQAGNLVNPRSVTVKEAA